MRGNDDTVLHIQAVRLEDIDFSQEQGVNLVLRLADRGGGGDHLGPDLVAIDFPGAEFIDRRFVEADQGAQRPADEM